MVFVSIILIAGLVLLIVVVAHHLERKRREALLLLANDLAMEFVADPGPVHDRYGGFKPFGAGSSRRSSNLIAGRRGEIDWRMFDYRYTTGSGKNRQTHRVGVIAAEVPLVLPRFTMRAEGFLDRLAEMTGFQDINFESEEFSRRYHVQCDDRKFAYDLIHPKMIEYLMRCRPRHWQLAGRTILLAHHRRYSPEELREVLGLIEGFMERIPAYVRQDRGLGAARP